MSDSQAIDLFAPHSPEQIAQTLKRIMDDPMPGIKARVYGKGSEREMTLRYRQRDTRTNMEPTLDAVMESHKGGTRITGTFGTPPGARYFPFIWVGFLSLFVIGGVAAYLYIPGAGLFATIFAGIPLLMIVAGLAAFRAQSDHVDDLEKILAFLAREIDARPIA
jgi:Flp pilus assembly protein TadB